jgi:site-specific DNA-methyltransferase (adenine-specific)
MTLLHGDCLEVMKTIPDKSIDLVLADPPYGTTPCKWDSIIPFKPMWESLNRISKGIVALFGSEPFSSALRMSNIKEFKYDWYLNKNNPTNALNCNKAPMRKIEVVSVFNKGNYFPQGLIEYKKVNKRGKSNSTTGTYAANRFQHYTNYPNNLIDFKKEMNRFHPTQKPVALLEYLIKTYTLEGETVLDFTTGSGSTGVACKNLNRKFIGIEQDEKYYQIACGRCEGTTNG